MRIKNAAGLRPVFIVVLATLVAINSCGGGSTITNDTLTPGTSFDDQIHLVNPFTLDDADHNGIDGAAVINGVALTEGGYPTITVPVGKKNIKASFAVVGHGFIQPGGTRATTPVTDLYDVSSGLQVPLCTAKTSVDGLPDVSSRLDILRENQETILVEDLRQKDDVEIEVAITLKAEPTVAQRIAGRNLGMKDIPAEHKVQIEQKRNNANSLLGLVLGVAIRTLLGDVIGAASGVVEVACGDSVVVLHAKLLIKGRGDTTPPPPPPPTITMSLTGPTEGNEGATITLTLKTNCTDWIVSGPEGQVAIGNGDDTIGVVLPSVSADTSITFVVEGCGKSDSHDVLVRNVGTPPPTNNPPSAMLTSTPDHGDAPLTVTLDASGSTDSDGTIEKYEYDYEGNGTWFDAGTDTSVTHSYATAGTRTPRVRVTDDKGATNIASAPVITVTNGGGGNVTYTFFVAGTKGPLTEGAVWEVDETGSQIVNIFEIRGSDNSKMTIPTAEVAVEFSGPYPLPVWCWVPATGEIATVLWAEPQDPDVTDLGNIFINPGDYLVKFSVTSGGTTYHRNWTLRVLDRPDFP